jgi:hypothetical protein
MASGGEAFRKFIYRYSLSDLALIADEMVFVRLEAKPFRQSKVVAS